MLMFMAIYKNKFWILPELLCHSKKHCNDMISYQSHKLLLTGSFFFFTHLLHREKKAAGICLGSSHRHHHHLPPSYPSCILSCHSNNLHAFLNLLCGLPVLFLPGSLIFITPQHCLINVIQSPHPFLSH